jgi:hypothetical protein
MSFYLLCSYFEIVPKIPNSYFIVGLLALVWVINYYFFVRDEKFLNYKFGKDKLGGYSVIAILILTTTFAIAVGNINRKKIFEQRRTQTSGNSKQAQLLEFSKFKDKTFSVNSL